MIPCTRAFRNPMKKKQSSGFSLDELRRRGFSPDASGAWSKGNPSNQGSNAGPSGGLVEPSPKKRAKRKSRGEGEGKGGGQPSHRFQLVVVSYRTKLIDASNACVKHIEDVIVSRGFMPDDSPKYCPAPRFIQIQVPEGEERTEVYLFRLFTEASPP